MADTTEIKWIYPPNWDGFIEDNTGFRRMKVRLTGVTDGTGETDVIKVARADLMTHNKNIPSKIVVEDISWSIHGMSAVLEWDYTDDQIIARINGGTAADSTGGDLSFKQEGGLIPDDDTGTGNLILSTTNCNAGDTYDITLGLRLKD